MKQIFCFNNQVACRLMKYMVIAVLTFLMQACGDSESSSSGSGPNPGTSITQIAIDISNPISGQSQNTIHLGQTAQLTLTAFYDDGHEEDVTAEAAFTSEDPTVLSIDTDAIAHALTIGNTRVSASIPGYETSEVFNVDDAVAVGIEISPVTAQVIAGLTIQYQATTVFSDGTTQPSNSSVQWDIMPSDNVSISDEGLVTTQLSSEGEYDITASDLYGNVSNEVTLTVDTAMTESLAVTAIDGDTVPAGITKQFKAVVTLNNQQQYDVTSYVEWVSQNEAVAEIDESGLATTKIKGDSVISAHFLNGDNEETGQANLTVTDAILSSIEINSDDGDSLPIGLSKTYHVEGIYSDDSTQLIGNTLVQWGSTLEGVATIDTNGVAKGIATGSTSITADFEGKADDIPLQVSGAVVTAIDIESYTDTVVIDGSSRVKAMATYSDESRRDMSYSAAWTTDDAGIVNVQEIDSKQRAVGNGEGTTSIHVTLDGASADYTLTVDINREPDFSIACGQGIVSSIPWDLGTFNYTCPLTAAEAQANAFEYTDDYGENNTVRFNYDDAKRFCEELKVNGRDDWRMPIQLEMDKLYDSAPNTVLATYGWPESEEYRLNQSSHNGHDWFDINTGVTYSSQISMDTFSWNVSCVSNN